ncbi:unnamed protein product [Amaranthus hypochondriacus]
MRALHTFSEASGLYANNEKSEIFCANVDDETKLRMWGTKNLSYAGRDRLLTCARLRKLGVKDDDKCLLCGLSSETIPHLFFNCHFSHQLLAEVGKWLQWSYTGKSISGFWFWTEKCRGKNGKSSFIKKLSLTSITACVYYVWKCRNTVLWEHYLPPVQSVFKVIRGQVKGRCSQLLAKKISTLDLASFESL